MKYTVSSTGNVVQAANLPTSIDLPAAKYAGVHYCKILSPLRALEWMYVDSLRGQTATSQQLFLQ